MTRQKFSAPLRFACLNITNFYKPSDSPLLNQVRQIMRLKHMSRSTEKSYLYYILDYIYFHNKRHPQECDRRSCR
ncbi:MAG: phage integrase N-terminal SAM-like domain-containing protein, partial [Pseudanabaena sp.]